MSSPSTAAPADQRQQLTDLANRFSGKVIRVEWPGEFTKDVPVVHLAPAAWLEVLRFLKEDPSCDYRFLADYTATDETPRSPRFDLVVHLLCPRTMLRLRVKASVDETFEADSLIPLWLGANWAEREIWDMFGLRIKGHPDLRRILMDQRWQGHPLRKDYPLRGYQFFPTPEVIDPKLLES